MSGANDPEIAATEAVPVPVPVPADDPLIRVLHGNPSEAQIAALVAVVGAAIAPKDGPPPTRDMWGHPVDALRVGPQSWQMVTLVERTHLRR